MEDILIVYNKEAEDWNEFVMDQYKESNGTRHMRFMEDTELVDLSRSNRALSIKAKEFVIIASPGHLELIRNSGLSYKTFLPKNTGVVLLCGTEMGDFNREDKQNRPLFERFSNFAGWKIFDHKDCLEMVKHLVTGTAKTIKSEQANKLVSSSASAVTHVKLIPTTAACEGGTTLILSFPEPIGDQSEVQILMTDEDEGAQALCLELQTRRLNPYTYTFITPEHKAGPVSFKIMLDNKKLNSGVLSTTFTTQLGIVTDLSLIYLNQICTLTSLLSQTGLSTPDLDVKLASFFEADDVPLRAFEWLFRIHEYSTTEPNMSELPTLLHFAARFGFQELCSKLIDLPDSDLAYRIPTKDGKLPEDLAKENEHHQLASFLETFRKTDDEINEVYTKMCGYVEHDPGPKYVNDVIKRMSRNAGKQKEPPYINLSRDNKRNAPSAGPTNQGERNEPRQAPPPPTLSSATPSHCCLNESDKKLVEIMEFVKEKQITISEAEILFKQWRMKYQVSPSRSFKERQEQLVKVREEVAKAKGCAVIDHLTANFNSAIGQGGQSAATMLRESPSDRSSSSSSGSRDSANSCSTAGSSSGIEANFKEEQKSPVHKSSGPTPLKRGNRN